MEGHANFISVLFHCLAICLPSRFVLCHPCAGALSNGEPCAPSFCIVPMLTDQPLRVSPSIASTLKPVARIREQANRYGHDLGASNCHSTSALSQN